MAEDLAATVGRVLREQQLVIATAESCTGGWLAKRITDVGGSSAWFDRGFVTYSNDAKHDELGVNESTLLTHGAVSEETAREMAEGTLHSTPADLAVAVTGVAGPDGGTDAKPVGTVWLAWAWRNHETRTQLRRFSGDRENVRRAAVNAALAGVLNILAPSTD